MKLKGLFALLTLGFVVFLASCTKLNSPTELGGELLPAVDNVNTFDTTLDLSASYHPFLDSSKHLFGEAMALGQLTDPEFGNTMADMYFNLSAPTEGVSPFFNKDSVIGVDSVVLSLSYVFGYGDTTAGGQITVAVSEINKGNGFNDTTLYRYDNPGFATGPTLGSKSFSIPTLKDSITLIRKSDTTKVANVLRIRLNNTLGEQLSRFDTTNDGPYKKDSLFRLAFRGLAVKTTSASTPGALAYFNASQSNSGLTVYFRVQRNGAIDTTAVTFTHKTYSQANSIRRTPGGAYLANLNQANPQLLYIQSSPSGSYTAIKVPGLTNFPNKIIHRAELIAYKVPSALDNILTPPNRLLLDHIGATDTAAFIFDNDLQPTSDGGFANLSGFGGTLRSDNSYRFNITRYVQGIVTRRENNDTLRLYAPLRSNLYSKTLRGLLSVPNLNYIANGRVVLAGPNFVDPAYRMKLYIVYSNL